MELRLGLMVAERFRLVRPLGQGGMGAIWRLEGEDLEHRLRRRSADGRGELGAVGSL
jgi:hypothetical protein